MVKIESLFIKFPITEVLIRLLYSKIRNVRFVKRFSKRFVKRETATVSTDSMTCAPYQLFQHVEDFGIKKGDILIVHSSMETLGKTGLNAKQVIDKLLELIGDDGTLVMPAFPQFTKKETINGVEVEVYDVKRTVAWTGIIPNMFLRYKGVIRSEWPCNPLAAKGVHAEEMMRDNLKAPVSQGRGTAWGYCTEHHAKVLFLGVRPFHSLSESHIAEDYLCEEWPVDNWYVKQKYIIKNGTKKYSVTLNKRNPDWAAYLTEYRNSYRMRKEKILIEDNYCGIQLGFIEDLKVFNEKRMADIRKGVLDYIIPKKYWKKSER